MDRFYFGGFVSNADLNDYYLPVFKRPLSRARPAAIMVSPGTPNQNTSLGVLYELVY